MLPHAPQLVAFGCEFVVRLTHVPPQSVSPAVVHRQTPFTRWVPGGHAGDANATVASPPQSEASSTARPLIDSRGPPSLVEAPTCTSVAMPSTRAVAVALSLSVASPENDDTHATAHADSTICSANSARKCATNVIIAILLQSEEPQARRHSTAKAERDRTWRLMSGQDCSRTIGSCGPRESGEAIGGFAQAGVVATAAVHTVREPVVRLLASPSDWSAWIDALARLTGVHCEILTTRPPIAAPRPSPAPSPGHVVTSSQPTNFAGATRDAAQLGVLRRRLGRGKIS